MDPRVAAIAALTAKLKPPPDEMGGVFLPPDAAPQFDFMFLAEMPSQQPKWHLGNFQTTARDKLLRDTMLASGVGGSYVTDIVKARAVPRQPTKDEIVAWLPFLLDEVAIIQPRAIIILGKRTYEQTYLPHVASAINPDVLVDYVYHYSSQVPIEQFKQRFALVVAKLRQQLQKA